MEFYFTEEAKIPDLAYLIAEDQVAMKWLAFYSDPVRWVNSFSDYRQTLTVQDGEDVIGFIELTYKYDSKTVAIDYCIFPPYRGQGKAKYLLKELHQWLLVNSSARSIVAYVDPENFPSVRALEKVGYLNHGKVAWGLLLYTYFIQ